jgi:hypothetical protein
MARFTLSPPPGSLRAQVLMISNGLRCATRRRMRFPFGQRLIGSRDAVRISRQGGERVSAKHEPGSAISVLFDAAIACGSIINRAAWRTHLEQSTPLFSGRPPNDWTAASLHVAETARILSASRTWPAAMNPAVGLCRAVYPLKNTYAIDPPSSRACSRADADNPTRNVPAP